MPKYCEECHGRGWVWEPIYRKVAANFVPKQGPNEPLEERAYKKVCMSCLRAIDNSKRTSDKVDINA